MFFGLETALSGRDYKVGAISQGPRSPRLTTMTDHDEYFEYLSRRSRLGALYRAHWLYPRLARRLVGRSLDIGCGIGDMLVYRANMVGVDINPRTISFCHARGVSAYLMQSDALPSVEGEFDSALLDNVLEHVAQPQRLLSEVQRVLRPAGRVLVGVPGIRGWASDADHKVFYDESALAACMAEAGFDSVETFHTPLWRSACLDRHVRQYCLYGLFERR